MYQLIIQLIIGGLAGLHSACWGFYKDSLYEPAHGYKFLRSLMIAVIGAFFFYLSFWYLGVKSYNLGVFFATVVLFERYVTEIYKDFFRVESLKRYKIPSSFHIGRHIFKHRVFKQIAGSALIAVPLLVLLSLNNLPKYLLEADTLIVGLLVGLFMGTLEAFGGAEKDAPYEGFYPLKIFRSPIIHMFWGGIFSFYTGNLILIFLASGGAGRMTIEFYKTFITRHPPGKFGRVMAIYPEWENKRKIVIVPYILTWTIFLYLLFHP